jgi:prolyl-tRNA editing enzyme YbaK/EbsC (Cys-tRNA(Pro) deacylase)
MTAPLSPSAQRIQDALAALGADCAVVELPGSTRTAADAAAAVGCTVAQIAKSIVFRTAAGKLPVMVIASGANRVDETKIAAYLGEPIEKADAAYVREKTGFAIGGVPPVGHAGKLRIFVDEDLLALGELWAAAGTPNSVFKLRAQDLVALTGGDVKPIKP